MAMQTRARFKVTSFTMQPKVFKTLKAAAESHDVPMSGLVNLAVSKLLDDKSPRQIELLLKREGVGRRWQRGE
jgi:hypothetical protein